MNDTDLYLQVSLKQAEIVTKTYSSSFSRSLLLVDRSIRPAIYAIYGMVRIADEIVDTHFSGEEAHQRLTAFEQELYNAVHDKYSSNPILHAFQWAVTTYAISLDHVHAFFASMQLDTQPHTYTQELYEQYIYGSAEVVGLMCLTVFCNGNVSLEAQLTPGARALGAAFQKVNFLRDITSDFQDRKRIYFSSVTSLPISRAEKAAIENDIKKDFTDAATYVEKLPVTARYAVRLAYQYYMKLFSRIVDASPDQLSSRIRVGAVTKACIFAQALLARLLHV